MDTKSASGHRYLIIRFQKDGHGYQVSSLQFDGLFQLMNMYLAHIYVHE